MPGRDSESPRWYVIREGLRAALLEHPRQEDMFWWSYAVTALPQAPGDVYSPEFWQGTTEVEHEGSGFRIRSVYAGRVQPRAQGERVWLRGFIPYPRRPGPRPSFVQRVVGLFRRTPR